LNQSKSTFFSANNNNSLSRCTWTIWWATSAPFAPRRHRYHHIWGTVEGEQ
jgi:hypothetical protein